MPNRRKRHSIVLASTLILAAAGAISGYLLALQITVSAATARLGNYAAQLTANSDHWAAEARSALAEVDASPSNTCSAREVGYLRALIFQTDFLKDAGLMQGDGQIQCSAAMGRPPHPWPVTKPDFVVQGGVAVYTGLGPYVDQEFVAIAIQHGRSFVVFTPFARMQVLPPPMHFTQTILGVSSQVQHDSNQRHSALADPRILTAPGTYREKDDLYVTRCSIGSFTCETAYTSIPEMVAANRVWFQGCILLCAILGASVGFIFSMIYRRSKSLEQQLRRAVRKDRLKVVYQPIVDLASGRIAGAEALARWTDEENHPVPPDIFVHLAEQQGFVGEITRLVVRHVLRELGPVLRHVPDFRVSVNVTSRDLADPSLPDFLAISLAQAQVSPQSLIIEITESSTASYDVATKAIHALRERGHKVHIDDFGTGYSSLSYLQNLSVDAIKIDRSFTQSIGTGSATTAILPQILAMAEALHLRVIVEGVETEQQAAYFTSPKKPVQAQGWLFGRPMPADQFFRILAEHDRMAPESEAVARPKMAIVA